MISEAQKTIEAIVEIELKSGKKELKFDFDAIAYIEEQTGLSLIEFLFKTRTRLIEGINQDSTDSEKNNEILKNITAKDVLMLLFAGLAHLEEFKDEKELKKELITVNYYKYKVQVMNAVGKLIMDFITPKQNT